MLVFLTIFGIFITVVTINIIVSERRNKFQDFLYGIVCRTRVTRTRERLLSSEYDPIKDPKFVYYPEYEPLAQDSYRGFILKSDKKREVHFNTEAEAERFIKEMKDWHFAEYKAGIDRFGLSMFAFMFLSALMVALYSTFGLIK